MKKLIALVMTVALLCTMCIATALAVDYEIVYASKNNPGLDEKVVAKNDDEQRFYVTVVFMDYAVTDTVYFGSRFATADGKNVTSKITSDGLPYNENRDPAQSCAYFSSAGAKKGSKMKLQMKLHQNNSFDTAKSKGRWNP